MKIELLEIAGWYTIFKNLRQSYSLDTRSTLTSEIGGSWNCGGIIGMPNIIHGSNVVIGDKDLQLLSTLVKKGDSHSKIIRGLQTYVEITAPRYFWQEWITYVIGVLEINPTIDWVSLNSESTMHTLSKQELSLVNCSNDTDISIISCYNKIKKEGQDVDLNWIKANLPEGYLQTRTFQVSYQAWRRIYQQRENHKLEEWNTDIIQFIKSLPFAKELITINYEM